MSQSIEIVQILVSAGSGAVAGSVVSIFTGSTIAEREERGRLRIAARQAIGRALRTFRYNLANSRLLLIDGQDPNEDEVLSAAFELAKDVYESLPVMPRIERHRLKRSIGGLLGREMILVARLRPDQKSDITDIAHVSTIMRYRTEPGSALKDLLRTDPNAAAWEKAIRRSERLGRRYV